MQIHSGFLSFYQKLKIGLETTFSNLIASHPSYSILLTGHSLGGALASVAALDMFGVASADAVRARTTVITFGQPRVGDCAFAQVMGDLFEDRYLRVTHGQDPVPLVPPHITFVHGGLELWFSKSDDIAGVDDPGSITVCADSA